MGLFIPRIRGQKYGQRSFLSHEEKSLEDACFASPLGVGPGPTYLADLRGRPTCGAAYGIHGSVRPRLCLLSAEECYQLFFQFFVQSYDATVSLRVLKVVSKSPWVRGE